VATEWNEAEFEQVADEELRQLVEALIACSDELDPDLESGVLSLNFEDDSKYVINSHRAAKQIWMAAERSAWHFDYDAAAKKWVAAQSGDELWTALSRLVGAKLGTAVALTPLAEAVRRARPSSPDRPR
jgi:CyaY protein